jgi:hypothetical protein
MTPDIEFTLAMLASLLAYVTVPFPVLVIVVLSVVIAVLVFSVVFAKLKLAFCLAIFNV